MAIWTDIPTSRADSLLQLWVKEIFLTPFIQFALLVLSSSIRITHINIPVSYKVNSIQSSGIFLNTDFLFQRDMNTCQILQVCREMKPPIIGFHLFPGEKEMKSEIEIKGDAGVDDSLFGSMEITYKHEESEHTIKFIDYGFLYKDGEVDFKLLPKYQEIEDHEYYLSLVFKAGLKIGEKYQLGGEDAAVKAQLEIDHEDGDKYASGTFELSRSGDYPVGTFNISEEGVFSAVGKFEYAKQR